MADITAIILRGDKNVCGSLRGLSDILNFTKFSKLPNLFYLCFLRLDSSIYSVYTNSVLGLEVHTSWRIAFVP